MYRRVFESSPVALAQFDLSGLHAEMLALGARVGGGCALYLDEHPDEVPRLAGLLEIRRLNRAAVTLYEATSEESLRESLEALVLPESLPIFREVVLALATGGRAVEGEASHRTVNGAHLDVRVMCHLPLPPSEADPLVVSVVDLTEQKAGERLLREIAEELGKEVGERYFEEAVRFMGERLGADLAFVGERSPDGDSVRTLAAWQDGGPAPDFEYPLRDSPCHGIRGRGSCVFRDGVQERFPGHHVLAEVGARGYVGAALVSSDGTSLGMVVAAFREPLSDSRLTESVLTIFASRAAAEVERARADAHTKDLEARLIHAQRLESVGRLAGGVAHDFNNLLAPIMAYSEMALDVVEEGNPLRDDLKEILSAAERASKVTRQLLAFSRRQVLELQNLDLSAAVEGFGRMLRTVLREDIRLDTRLGQGLPLIRGDQGQLEQVLLNLVLNAQDAMPEGGRMTVATFRHQVPSEGEDLSPGTYVCLEVEDTGTGMDPFTLDHIFEPFFTTKSSQEGTGLGLATVYGIVQQHRGGIDVESEVGRGTRFRVFLPVSEAEGATEAPAEATDGRRSGSECIMVVEDESAVRRLVVTVLRRHGYSVVEASSSLQGLEVALDPELDLDLLVTDVVMPQMDGVELYRRINQSRPDLPVLYLSGYAHDVIEARGVTQVNLLPKPFTLRDLTDRVREALER
jgi:signal transduction histidine kinase/CheY-like chemotaxis protein